MYHVKHDINNILQQHSTITTNVNFMRYLLIPLHLSHGLHDKCLNSEFNVD